jgi:hypothetical protein
VTRDERAAGPFTTNKRSARLVWIAQHLSGVRVSYTRGPVDGETTVEPREVAEALLELVQLREEKARNWKPRPTLVARLRTWWRDNRP